MSLKDLSMEAFMYLHYHVGSEHIVGAECEFRKLGIQ